MSRLRYGVLGILTICAAAIGVADDDEAGTKKIPFSLDAALGGGIVELGADVGDALKATVSAEAPTELGEWMAKLGGTSFLERETASRELLKYLASHSLATRIVLQKGAESSNPEVRMRSKQLLEQGQDSQMIDGLLEWIALRRIPGMLPLLQQAPVELWHHERAERLPDIVEMVATKDDLPLLRKWCDHSLPAFRRSAAKAIARVAGTKELVSLFGDSDPTVRLEVAIQLGRLSDPRCIAMFKALIGDDDFLVRSRSGYALECLTGEFFGFVGTNDTAKRTAFVKTWQEFKISKPRFPLDMPRSILSNGPVGENLYVLTTSPGQIQKYDRNGDLLAKDPVPFTGGASDLLPIPGGRFLLAGETEEGDYSWKIIKDGKVIRTQARDTYACPSYISNGNLICCEETHAFELDENNREILNIPVVSGRGRNAWRTHYGTTLVASSLGVREYDRKGSLLWETTYKNDFVICCQGLRNGNVLVVLARSNRVIEVNRDKQIVWTWASGARRPRDCFMLPNNHLLVATDRGALELTRNKAVLWEIKSGNIWQVRRGD